MTDSKQYPVDIPPTSLERYISFGHALNLRLPGEDTGDWHFKPMFFSNRPGRRVKLAGKGQRFDTHQVLGVLGIRDVSAVLRRSAVVRTEEPIFGADHYRAIADMVAESFSSGKEPIRATPRQINDWLDTPEQIETLRNDYLAPLIEMFDGETQERFSSWLATVVFR